jgi:hypothetical protein
MKSRQEILSATPFLSEGGFTSTGIAKGNTFCIAFPFVINFLENIALKGRFS